MVATESLSRDIMRLIVWYPVRWFVAVAPLGSVFSLFRLMGDIHYLISRGKKAHVMNNMKNALGERLGDEGLKTAARYYFRNHYMCQMQVLVYPRLNRGNLGKIHTFEGLEHLDEALNLGKGCILVHPHFGPAQLPLCALGRLGYPMMQLGFPTDEGISYIGKKVSFRLRMRYEAMIPAQIISAMSFLRPLIIWLNSNKVLMMTGDGAGGGKFIGKFIPVDFLGRKVLFPIGAASLADKTGAVILPMFISLCDNGTYKTIIHRQAEFTGDGKETVKEKVSRFAQMLERYIHKYPYLWHLWDEWDKRLEKSLQ